MPTALTVRLGLRLVLELATDADSLLALEVAYGCMGQVEQLLDELRETILEQ